MIWFNVFHITLELNYNDHWNFTGGLVRVVYEVGSFRAVPGVKHRRLAIRLQADDQQARLCNWFSALFLHVGTVSPIAGGRGSKFKC